MQIQPYEPDHLPAIVQLSLRAWSPVFESIKNTMDPGVYREFYPNGWRSSQQKDVEDACSSPDTGVWVATDADVITGFVAVTLHEEDMMGEIYMIAVDPNYQGQGIGKKLSAFALDRMKASGMRVAMVETGSDPGHAPARRTYESLGFGLLPVSRYFKKL